MFTYIKAKNFKSLKDVEFNLKRTKTKINDFIAIYGENGSGKTHIVELFKFLQQLTISRTFNTKLAMLPKEFFELKQKMMLKTPIEFRQVWQLALNLEEYRMIDEAEDTEVEYGFNINGIDGYYYIKFNQEIVEEKLYYMCNNQRGFQFKILKDENGINRELNRNIFFNDKYCDELEDNINKYWGKYSFISLLTFEMNEKNEQYMNDNISQRLFDIINKIVAMTIHAHKWDIKFMPDNFMKQSPLTDLKAGTVKKDKLKEIEKYEKVLNIFFTQAYADIKSVKYLIQENEEDISYQLCFQKLIGGKVRNIPIELESQGTAKIIEEFDTIVGAMMGETVVIDEIDNGIHDLLMKNIILSIKDEITGQLIITTHNTLLLEILPKESIYILSTDYEGNKTINSIKEYGLTIQKNHNARDLYFKGLFGGVPTTSYVDFEEIKYVLEDTKEEGKDANEKT